MIRSIALFALVTVTLFAVPARPLSDTLPIPDCNPLDCPSTK